MTLKIKQLLNEFHFATEAELFASDLRYKFCDDSLRNIYRNDYPQKHEDLMDRLKGKLSKTVQSYKAKFAELVKVQGELRASKTEPLAARDTNTLTKEQQLLGQLGL
jgi:hypothetical protein